MMKKNQRATNGVKNLINSSNRINVDSKLTQIALLLEYAFEHKVDFKNRIIKLSKDIDAEEFDRVDTALTEMESQSRAGVTIKINSSGGEVYHALAIIGRLKKSKCKITTEGYGHVMSAATMILAAGDSRHISKYAFFMHHEASYEVDGRHSFVKNEVKQKDKEEELWSKWMEELTKTPMKFWLKQGIGKDAYFSAEELLKLGVVDEVF